MNDRRAVVERRLLLALATAATALGLATLYSASVDVHGVVSRQIQAQATHAVLGVGIGVALSQIRTERLRDRGRLLWIALMGLLAAVYVYGTIKGGARSWLELGPMRIQPAELVKVGLPVVLAGELARPGGGPAWRRWAIVAVLGAVPLALIAVQPDLGSAGLVGIGVLALAYLGGLPRWVWGGGALLGALAAPVGWANLQPYQQARVLTFLDPTRDPSGDGYQPLQSLYAVAAGGWTGAGWQAGTQGRLGFLPEHTTDFILSQLAEEWGVLGALTALAVVLGIALLGLSIAERARDRFTSLLAGTLALQLAGQVAVNAGGVLGLLPLTGVTLPFFSYGGSSLLSVWMCVGLLAAAARSPARLRVLSGQVAIDRTSMTPAAAARSGTRWEPVQEAAP